MSFAANGNNEYPIKVYADGDDINPDTYTLAFKKFKNTLELSEITVNGRKAKRDPDNVRKFTIDVMSDEQVATIIAKAVDEHEYVKILDNPDYSMGSDSYEDLSLTDIAIGEQRAII